jgi:endo-1,4-beta-mannosidase
MHSIRFFAAPWGNRELRPVFDDPVKRETIFHRAMDTALDLCDKNDIKVVYSLGAGGFTDTANVPGKGWVFGEEQPRELMSNPNSRGRQELYRYIDDVVSRYKNRKTILMWEISNETTLSADIMPDQGDIYQGERMPTLADVAGFLDDDAKRIKANDPLRLVNSGGSIMRGCQWNQYTKHKWIVDTVEEQNKALDLLYGKSAVDIIDIHYYPGNKHADQMVKGPNGEDVPMNIFRYMDAAQRIGKPLMIGETGAPAVRRDDNPKDKQVYKETPDYFDSYRDPNAVKWVQALCDEIVASGPQLCYWWEYSSDRDVDLKDQIFDLKKGQTDPVLDVIVDANKRLKAKYDAR